MTLRQRVANLKLLPVAAAAAVIAAPVLFGTSLVIVRNAVDPMKWLQSVGVLCVAVFLSRIAALIAPPGRQIPPGMATIGREGWEALAYLLSVLLVVAIPTVPLVLTVAYVDKHPEAIMRALPLASVFAGLIFGCAVTWLIRARVRGLMDALGVIGFCAGIIGGVGSGIAYLLVP